MICSLVAGFAVAGAGSAAAAPAVTEAESFVPGQVVVRFAPGSGRARRRASLAAVHTRATDDVEGVGGARVVDLPEGETVAAAIELLERREDVLWAEPNYVLHTTALPNDPLLGRQWGIRNTGQNTQPIEYGEPVFGMPGIDIGVAGAWDRTTRSGGPVAVIDSGIDPTQPDLAANLDRAQSRNFVPTPSLAPNPPVDPQAWGDVHGHGTHVAGIIGAVGDNGLGVAGVDWQAEVASVRVCGPDGECTSADVAAGLAYAGEAGFPVANVSLGSEATTPGDEIRLLREAIAAHPNTLYVVAAGNGDEFGRGFDVDLRPEYPCAFNLANIVCVAAIGPRGELTHFSNWGPESVDLGAPGENIESTFVNRLEPYFDDFGNGIEGWAQAPYPWEVGEVEEEPTLAFHGLDGGVPTPVSEASATLRTGLDLEGGQECWAQAGLSLELHGSQTLTIEAAAGGGPASPLPPTIYDASSLPAGEEVDVPAYLDRFDGDGEVTLSFVYRANGTETPLPSIDVGSADVRCIGASRPLGAYRALSGTSMATPFVAGIASLGRSLDPAATTAQLRQALLDSAVPTPSLAGKTVSGGRVSAIGVLDALSPPTPAPSPAAPSAPQPAATPAPQARLGRLRARPRRLALAPGRARWVRARVRNPGDAPARRVRICLRTPHRRVLGGRCTAPRRLAARAGVEAWFRLRLRRRARPGRIYHLRLSVHSPGLRQRRTVIALRALAPHRHRIRRHHRRGKLTPRRPSAARLLLRAPHL